MLYISKLVYIMFSKLYRIISNYALLTKLSYIILVCIQCAYMRTGPIGTGWYRGYPRKGKVCDTKTKDMA